MRQRKDRIVPVDVFLAHIQKNTEGEWSEPEPDQRVVIRLVMEKYGHGSVYQCHRCNVVFKTRARSPECPFCHTEL